MSLEDPFPIAQKELESSLRVLLEYHKRWKHLLQTTNTATDGEFKWTFKELKKEARGIEASLKDLREANIVTEKYLDKYRLTQQQQDARKRFVAESLKTLEGIKQEITSAETNTKMQNDRTEELLSNENRMNAKRDSRFSGLQRAVEEDNNDYLRENMAMQQRLVEDQDQGLDILSENVKDLGRMTNVMHDELKLHERILDRLGDRASNSQGALGNVMRKLDSFMEQTKSGVQWTLIIVLAVIFIVLVIISTTVLKK